MRQKLTIRALIVTLLAGYLVACAEHISERKGNEIQVVPVTYSVDLVIKKNNSKQAWQELDQYVTKHWQAITTQDVNIYWYTKGGKALAEKYVDHLLSLGVDSNKLHLSSQKPAVTKNVAYDLRLETTVHSTIVEICGYETIGNYGVEPEGCYVESARWQSMVNPEKMLKQ